MTASGNPYTMNSAALDEVQQHTFSMRNREVRAIVAGPVEPVKSEVDHVLGDLDYMQESLIDVGN